jgi:hypothetical protein
MLTCRDAHVSHHPAEFSLSVDGFIEEKQEAWNLFYKDCGRRTINIKEKQDLAKTLPDRSLFEAPYRNSKNKEVKLRYAASKLGEHHLFQLLGWNPQCVKTAATIWNENEHMTLVGLY